MVTNRSGHGNKARHSKRKALLHFYGGLLRFDAPDLSPPTAGFVFDSTHLRFLQQGARPVALMLRRGPDRARQVVVGEQCGGAGETLYRHRGIQSQEAGQSESVSSAVPFGSPGMERQRI